MEFFDKNITVNVGEAVIPTFKALRIEQRIGAHHEFELVLDLETGGNRFAHDLASSSDWLGETLTVRVGREASFLGVVSNVHMHREQSEFGYLIVSGYSATYRLETAPGNFSWTDKGIGDIVQQLCGDAGVEAKVNPAYKGNLSYVCQYGESQFDFIRRLAAQHKEWIYFDGTALVFGRPTTLPDAVKLDFGTNLSSLDIGVQTVARPEKAYSYHSSSDQQMNEETPAESDGQDGLARKAMAASLKIFKTPARQYAEQRINTGAELKDYMRRKYSAESAESHYVTAESSVAGLSVGSVVKIDSSFYQALNTLSQKTLGEFIITEITHEVGEDGYYRNRFKAIPSMLEVIPVPDVRFPNAETQMATVTRNDDPKGSGRIQVQMNWQSDGMHTDWIRVMTPDAGSSGDVKSNRGFVFIPEVGDQVLIGFRHGDPSRPYSLGSLFNGSTGKGGGKANKCKSLTSRSGSSLKLDDSKGSVTLHDKGGVNMNFDGAGNSTLSSNDSHTIEAGSNASINVGGAKGGGAPSFLTMGSDGSIKLKGSSSIRLEIDDGTYISLTPGNVKIMADKVSVVGATSAVIGTLPNAAASAFLAAIKTISSTFNSMFGGASASAKSDASEASANNAASDDKVVLIQGLEVNEQGVTLKSGLSDVTIKGQNVNVN